MPQSKKTLYRSGMLMAVLSLAALPLAVSAQSSTDTVVNATVGSTISISSVSPVTLGLAPGSESVVSSASDTVTVSTNNSSGYTLRLANADSETALVSGSDSIEAHAATAASPSPLADNTWGYAVAGGAFDGSYTAETNNASSSSTWAGVPASGSPTDLKTTSSVAAPDTTTVWYGVRVDATQPTGTYTGTVTYTAVVNP